MRAGRRLGFTQLSISVDALGSTTWNHHEIEETQLIEKLLKIIHSSDEFDSHRDSFLFSQAQMDVVFIQRINSFDVQI